MLAILRDWGPLFSVVVSVAALLLGLANRRMQTREHGWKAADRVKEQARSEWCRAVLRDLRRKEERTALVRGTPLYVPATLEISDDRREWALWGEQQGYFKVTFTRNNVTKVQLPQASVMYDISEA